MIRLRTFGRLTLEQDNGASVALLLSQPKRIALLTCLAAANPPGPRSRDTLMGLLWPELDEGRGRTALRQALHGVRRHLGEGAITGMGDERVGVDVAELWCDAAAFTAALARGERSEALALYAGPFLEGFHLSEAPEFERWVERERRRLELEAVAAAWQLVDVAESQGDAPGARMWAERALELSPYEEMGFRRYLRVLERQADGAAAVTAFAAFARHLSEDIGLEPSAETSELIAQIRNPHVLVRPETPTAPAQSPEVPLIAINAHPPVKPSATTETAPTTSSLLGRNVTRLPSWARWATALAGIVLFAGVLGPVRRVWQNSAANRTAIAVLPFRNLSADSAHAYFAAGVHDELLNQLAQVASLRVVGRTSVNEYEHTSKSLPQIAQELEVGSVVEASVQIVGDRMRVIVQLLDAQTQEELWVERYERRLDDAFAVQNEIAQRIVAAVGATITGAEASALRTAPTQSAAAYQLYLQGVEYLRRPGIRKENLSAAQQLIERALALDSTFAPAHAELAYVHWILYDVGGDPTAARLAQAQREAGIAIRLAPDLPTGHLALGLARYLSSGDFAGALREFKLGLRAAPNHAELWTWVGRLQRNLGNWDSAGIAFERARRLEPRSANLFYSIANTQHYLHRYPAAIDAYRQAIALAPDFLQARLSLAWSYVLWQGQVDTLRAVLADLPLNDDPGGGGAAVLINRLQLQQLEHRPDSVLALLRAPEASSLSALERMLFTGSAHRNRRDHNGSRLAFDSALTILDQAVRNSPDDLGIHSTRGIVLARLGRRTEALREATWLAQTREYRTDRNSDGWLIGERASILTLAGDTAAALAEIERALARPSVTTVHMLRLDPTYDGIRADIRFQNLIRKYADPTHIDLTPR